MSADTEYFDTLQETSNNLDLLYFLIYYNFLYLLNITQYNTSTNTSVSSLLSVAFPW